MYIQSKSCGNCGRSVPLSTQVGDRCPICGVYFGGQSTTRSTSTTYGYESRFDFESLITKKKALIFGIIYSILEIVLISHSAFRFPENIFLPYPLYFILLISLIGLSSFIYAKLISLRHPAVLLLFFVAFVRIISVGILFFNLYSLRILVNWISIITQHFLFLFPVIVFICVIKLYRTDKTQSKTSLFKKLQPVMLVILIAVIYNITFFFLKIPLANYTFYTLNIKRSTSINNIIESLESKNIAIKRMSIRILKKIGSDAKESIPKLEKLANDSDNILKGEAKNALEKIKSIDK